MGALSEMIRSNAESVRKSKLISDTNIGKRARVRAGIGIFGGGRCPVWLKPAGDHYDEVPEKKAIVVRIYMMADSGLGSPTICKILNN
jgi:hypothetical protein